MCGKCTCLISKIFFDYKLGNTNLIINIFIKEAFMKKKEMKTKVMAVAMSTVMVASICPAIPAVAATSSTDIAKIQDGTYTGTAKCIPDEYEEFDPAFQFLNHLLIHNNSLAGFHWQPVLSSLF